jgi:hypothetical protein
MENERPVYVLTVRAKPGVDSIRALRGWLKIGLRAFGLECVGITPNEEETTMDMRNYAAKYIKPDQVRDGPIQTRIIDVFESEQYGRPVLELETGSQFTLNDGNTNTLMKAWGYNSDDWIGQKLVLELGTYKDWRADPPEEKETVKVRAISPAKTAAGNSGAPSKPPLPPSKTVVQGGAASLRGEMDDEIPF